MQAAVNVYHLTRDVRCVVGGKECNKCCHFVGLTETTHGNQFLQVVNRQVLRHVRLDEARGNGVDGDVT